MVEPTNLKKDIIVAQGPTLSKTILIFCAFFFFLVTFQL